jgi:hypothetical protein
MLSNLCCRWSKLELEGMVKQLNFCALHAITNLILNSNKFSWELFLFFAWLFLAHNCDMLYQITMKSAIHIMFYWFRFPNFLVWDDGTWVTIRGKFSIPLLIASYCCINLLCPCILLCIWNGLKKFFLYSLIF